MNTRNLITQTVVTFAALALAGIGITVGARNLANPFDQNVLIAVGTSIVGAALAFFLVRVFSLLEK